VNKQKFHNLLKGSTNADPSDIRLLEKLQSDFPYSQVIHALTAKVLFDIKSSDAQKKLSFAAIYATDRKVLKKFIQGSGLPMPGKTIAPATPEKPGPPVNKDTAPTHTSQKAPPDNRLSDNVLESLEVLLETKRRVREEEEDKLKKSEEKKKESKSINIGEVRKPDEKINTPEVTNSPGADHESKQETTHLLTEKPVENMEHEEETERVSIHKKENTEVTESSPKDPLNKDSKEVGNEDNINQEKKEPASVAGKNVPTFTNDYIGELNKLEEKPVQGQKQSKQKEIIENFIGSEKIIRKPVVSDASQETLDLARESVSFKDHLISENLAKILIQQGKKNKAIDIYEKLIWKFPQKKSYFAAQIEELKNH